MSTQSSCIVMPSENCLQEYAAPCSSKITTRRVRQGLIYPKLSVSCTFVGSHTLNCQKEVAYAIVYVATEGDIPLKSLLMV